MGCIGSAVGSAGSLGQGGKVFGVMFDAAANRSYCCCYC